MRIPEAVVQEILNKGKIEDIVSDYVALQRKGDRLWGLSPFKTEKTPSFSVSPDKNAYYCFSTQKGGGVVQFIMEMEHLTYPEALHFLAKKLGISVEAEDAELSEEYKIKKALEELYERLAKTFHHFLLSTKQGEEARAYLQKRGLGDDIAKEFELGYAPANPKWLFGFLKEKKYRPDFLAESGLFSKRYPDYCIFSDRIMFPIKNLGGQTIAFGGRILKGDGPKYINSPETRIYKKGTTLFALSKAKDSIRKKDQAIICEGYVDVIALHASGAENAVAPLGTAFTSEQAVMLKKLGSHLSLLFDGDSAGIQATLKNLIIAEKADLSCDIIELPEGKDPADIFLESGSHALQKMLNYRVNAFFYLLQHQRMKENLLSPEGKTRIVDGFLPYLQSLQSEAKRESTINLLADILGISSKNLSDDVLRRSGKKAPVEAVRETSASKKDSNGSLSNTLDLSIMVALFINSGLFAAVRRSLDLDDLRHPWAKELFITLEESFREENTSVQHMLEKIETQELRSLLERKLIEGEYSQEAEPSVRVGVLRLRERNLLERRNSINFQLRRLNVEGGSDQIVERELLEELVIIDEAVKELRKQIDDRPAE